MSAEVLKEEIVKSGGVKVLIDLAVNDTDEPQIAMQAAKTLVMLGFLGMHILSSKKTKVMFVVEKMIGTGERSWQPPLKNVLITDARLTIFTNIFTSVCRKVVQYKRN